MSMATNPEPQAIRSSYVASLSSRPSFPFVTAQLDVALAALSLGDGDGASPHLQRARVTADGAGDRGGAALARCLLATVEALRGETAAARAHLDDAAGRGGVSAALVDEVNVLVDVVEDPSRWTDRAAGHLAGAGRDARESAVFDLLARLIAARDPSRTWYVGPRAMTVTTPDGTRIDLSQRPLLRGLFAKLLSAHLASKESTVTIEELVRNAWPRSEAPMSVLKNRLKVALSSMRKLGLRDAFVSAEGDVTAYRLTPAARFVIHHADRARPR